MEVLDKVNISQNEYDTLLQLIKFYGKLGEYSKIDLINGYIKISYDKKKSKFLYKTANNNLYFLEDNKITYYENIDEIFTKIDFEKEDADYLLGFIHLSGLEQEYKIGNLKNGVIDVMHLLDNTYGYIYNTKSKYYFLLHNGISTLIGR